METESVRCAEDECRHLETLNNVRTNIRNISHELSQPLMVIQGYLELIELGKFSADVDNMKRVLENVAGQMCKLQEIQGRLKEALQPNAMVGNS